ncbi:MAG TPA: hypothetical protein V6C76_15260 [Drouetiella sp.]
MLHSRAEVRLPYCIAEQKVLRASVGAGIGIFSATLCLVIYFVLQANDPLFQANAAFNFFVSSGSNVVLDILKPGSELYPQPEPPQSLLAWEMLGCLFLKRHLGMIYQLYSAAALTGCLLNLQKASLRIVDTFFFSTAASIACLLGIILLQRWLEPGTWFY